MSQQAIFGPFFATMFLTLIVWGYMYVRRIHFINSNKINPNDLTGPDALARITPPAVSNPSNNLKNLFEMPVLFYALALYLFVTGQVDASYVYAGWVFAGFRVLHSAVHCGSSRSGRGLPISPPSEGILTLRIRSEGNFWVRAIH